MNFYVYMKEITIINTKLISPYQKDIKIVI